MIERRAIELVAKLAPWLAPLPSAYFVARASIRHFDVPLWLAVVIGAAIETLGLTANATALRLYEWNVNSLTPAGNVRKGHTLAPRLLIWLTVGTGALYLVVVIGLTVMLEVVPSLATYALAVFPLFALTGTLLMAVRINQAKREQDSIESLKRIERKRLIEQSKCKVCGVLLEPHERKKRMCDSCVRRSNGETHQLPLHLSLAVLNRDEWTCYYCGKNVKEVAQGERHIDHFIPKSKGGEDLGDNLVTSCQSCNLSKHDRLPSQVEVWEFKQYLRAKTAGSDKKSQILALASSENGDIPVKQKDIARILKTSQGYVSTVIKKAEEIEANNGTDTTD